MAVIKCENCENEILDTEIVCPYCDYPVTKKKAATHAIDKSAVEESALAGETVKIATTKDFEKEKEAFLKSVGTVDENKDDDSNRGKSDSANDTTMRSKEVTYTRTSNRNAAIRSQERRASSGSAYQRRNARKTAKRTPWLLIIIGVAVIVGLIMLIINSLGGNNKDGDMKKKLDDIEVVSSANLVKGDGFEFDIDNSILTITSVSSIENYNAGDAKPWSNNEDFDVSDVKYLVIKDGIDRIGEYAFDDLENLLEVTIPASITKIGDSAFYGCGKLKKVIFDDDALELFVGSYAFTKCDELEEIVFPDGLKSIGEGAFKECESLEKVVITNTNAIIGADAFFGCENVVIYCREDSEAYEYADLNGYEIKIIDSKGKLVDDDDDDIFGDDIDEIDSITPGSGSNTAETDDTKKTETAGQTTTETKTEGQGSTQTNTQTNTQDQSNTQTNTQDQSNTQTNTQDQSNSQTNTQDQSNTQTNTQDQSNTQTNTQTTTQDSSLESLMGQLGQASTQEEQDKILSQIDQITQ